MADPPLTVAEAKAQIEQLQVDAEALDQDYVAVEEQVDQGKAELALKQQDAKAQADKVAKMKRQVGQVALAQFQNRNVDTAAQLFFTSDTEGFLSQISTVEKVGSNQNSVLQTYQQERAGLADLQKSSQTGLAALEKKEADLAALRAQSDKKIAESKVVLAKLTTQEQETLAAQDQRSSEEAQAAAESADPTSRDATRTDVGTGKGATALAFAKKQIGKPYRFGATGPGAYDCSGLTLAAWRAAGVSLSRTSQAQFHNGRSVSKSELQPGDLVFFYGGPSHVALYAGNGMVLHAPHPGSSVRYIKMKYMPFAGGASPGLTRARPGAGVQGAVVVASVLLASLLLGACSPPTGPVAPSPTARPTTAAPVLSPSGTPGPADIQSAVSQLFESARTGDRATWLSGLSARDPAFSARAETLFDNLGGLHLDRLAVTLTGATQPLAPARRALLGAGAEVRQASVRWQLPGETETAEQSVWLTLLVTSDGTRLAGTSDDASPDTPAQPIWWLAPVTRITRSGVILLLGAGQPSARWTDLTVDSVRDARRRLPAPLRRHWPDVVVVEVPATPADFEDVLGAAPRAYASTAAVTRPEGPTTDAAIRIVVNPASAAESETERRLTLTHETVHVATRSASSPAPLWVVEGLAEYVAYEAQPKARPAAQRRLGAALRTRGVPDGLPGDAAFGAGADDVTVAYAEAWTACRVVARDHSRTDLGTFYARLDDGASLQDASRDALGVDETTVVRSWRTELRRLTAGTTR